MRLTKTGEIRFNASEARFWARYKAGSIRGRDLARVGTIISQIRLLVPPGTTTVRVHLAAEETDLDFTLSFTGTKPTPGATVRRGAV